MNDEAQTPKPGLRSIGPADHSIGLNGTRSRIHQSKMQLIYVKLKSISCSSALNQNCPGASILSSRGWIGFAKLHQLLDTNGQQANGMYKIKIDSEIYSLLGGRKLFPFCSLSDCLPETYINVVTARKLIYAQVHMYPMLVI